MTVLLALLSGGVVFFLAQSFGHYQNEVYYRKTIHRVLKRPSTNRYDQLKYFSWAVGLVSGLVLVGLLLDGFHWLMWGGGVLGMSVPTLIDRERKSKLRWKNFSQFPDFLELLSMGLSAGLNFEGAWSRALTTMDPQGGLKTKLESTLAYIKLGGSREEALDKLTQELKDSRLSPLLLVVNQAIQRGYPLQTILLDQAKNLRTLALLSIEKKAQTASLRLLFPLMLFIFPTIFIVLFGPLILLYTQGGRLF